MRVVIAGGHGKIARLLGHDLVQRGDEVVGLVRNASHLEDLAADGIDGALLDLENSTVDDLAQVLRGADAAVFAAGAGPGSGIARKDTVDRAAAALLDDAAVQAGVQRLIQISAMGTDLVAGGLPEGMEPVFAVYLQAKAAAEDHLRNGRELDWTILRPGMLTDGPATGRVTLAASVPRGPIPRADVAAVILALLDVPGTAGQVLELISGPVPVAEAVAACTSPRK